MRIPDRTRTGTVRLSLCLLACLLLGLSACGPAPEEASRSDRRTPREGAAPAGAGAEDGGAGASSAGPLYRVTEVVDGDTIRVLRGGEEETLRLIGLDTPETRDPRRPVECYGREASERGRELLGGRRVRLAGDPSQDAVDRYGRSLVYVFREDGLFYNREMIRGGFANEYTYRTPYEYREEFRAAQREAREAKRGLWSPDTCGGDADRPAEEAGRRSEDRSGEGSERPAVGEGCDPNYAGACVPRYPPDVDCARTEARGFRVVGEDVHRLDGGGDGVACE